MRKIINYAAIIINTMLFALINQISGMKGMLIMALGELLIIALILMSNWTRRK